MFNPKGQTNIISMLLITGILVVAISSAYFWGLPLLQKNQDSTNIEVSVKTLKELSDSIEVVARDKISRTVPFDVRGFLSITNNTIEYQTISNAAYVSRTNWVALNEDDFQGTEVLPNGYGLIGKDKPGVLIAKSEPSENKIKNIFRIVFREIEDLNSNSGTQIILEVLGDSTVPSGKHKIIAEYDREEIKQGISKTNGNLRQVFVKVRIA